MNLLAALLASKGCSLDGGCTDKEEDKLKKAFLEEATDTGYADTTGMSTFDDVTSSIGAADMDKITIKNFAKQPSVIAMSIEQKNKPLPRLDKWAQNISTQVTGDISSAQNMWNSTARAKEDGSFTNKEATTLGNWVASAEHQGTFDVSQVGNEALRPWRHKGDTSEHQNLELPQTTGPAMGPFQFEVHGAKPAGNKLRSASVKTALSRMARNEEYIQNVIDNKMVSQNTRDLFQKILDNRDLMINKTWSNANLGLLKEIEGAVEYGDFASLLWVADTNEKRNSLEMGDLPDFSSTVDFQEYATKIQGTGKLGGYKKIFAARDWYVQEYINKKRSE